MDFSIAFVLYFTHGMYLISPIVGMLLVIIIGLGLVVGRVESWSRFDAVYWAFVTAMTVGYGDIRPTRKTSKSLSIVIAYTGLVLAGISVAIALEAASKAFKEYGDDSAVKQVLDKRLDKSKN